MQNVRTIEDNQVVFGRRGWEWVVWDTGGIFQFELKYVMVLID